MRVERRVRDQSAPNNIHYVFAPLKQARLDYMVQKATEMGASRLTPVLTRRAQLRRVSEHRLRANAIEAAEQCGLLTIPETVDPIELDRYLAELDPQRLLVFCDEDAAVTDPLAPLRWQKRRIGRESFARRADRSGRRLRRDGARIDIADAAIFCGFPSALGFCAPIRPLWPRSPSFRRR